MKGSSRLVCDFGVTQRSLWYKMADTSRFTGEAAKIYFVLFYIGSVIVGLLFVAFSLVVLWKGNERSRLFADVMRLSSWNNLKSLYEQIGSDSNWKTMIQWKPIKLFVCLCVNQVTSGTNLIFPLKTILREHLLCSLKEILRTEKVNSKKHHFDLVYSSFML